MPNEYQPFAINEFKTGLFQYLEPWIRPLDAFEPIVNGYVYRGTLNKRQGYQYFGRLTYRDNIAVGNGSTTSFSGTLLTNPIIPGSLIISDGTETFTDNGNGTLTRSPTPGGTNTINYTSGAWAVQFNTAPTNHVIIYATFQPNNSSPIMGILNWVNETDGTKKLIVFDTNRASLYDDSTGTFLPLYTLSQVLWAGNASSGPTITVNCNWAAVSPYTDILTPFTVTLTDSATGESVTDNGSGVFGSSSTEFSSGTVNYATGAIGITFKNTASASSIITITAQIDGDYFTGNYRNFFNSTNWLGDLYVTNAVDPITLFDGTNLSRPAFPITQANQIAYTNNIGTCLDVDVYKNRLLVQRPYLINTTIVGVDGQSIRWSAINVPTNLVADVAGNGGELSATTDDYIESSEFLRDQLIVLFQNSTWTFRFTGNATDPFRWDKINNSKSTNAAYGTVDYDERVTALGSKGFIACDGQNVQRYDVNVIDLWEDIDQFNFRQCFSKRFDPTNQTWTLYPSVMQSGEINSSTAAFIYNFLENSWAQYTFYPPNPTEVSQYLLSCLGTYLTSTDQTWNSLTIPWDRADYPWDAFFLQSLSPILLGGGQTGIIYQMENGVTDGSTTSTDGVPITTVINSTRWNPFIGSGQRVQFGYIDIYYDINPEAILNLEFNYDNTTSSTIHKTLTLDGPVDQTSSFKRIYINVIGEFLQMSITDSSLATWKILGMILWARPAGRLTPGYNV